MTSRTPLRVAVIGLGAMGSAAALHLARRGADVIGFEQFGPAHDRGSSHGESRIIRKAYYEDPCYVPLILRAYELWRELEEESGETLLKVTGGLMIGRPGSEVVAGALASAQQWRLPHQLLTSKEIHQRFAAFTPEPDQVAVFEPDAGILLPELAVLCHLRQAVRHGAQLHFGEQVEGWAEAGAQIALKTPAGEYRVDRLVVAAGPWTGRMLSAWDLPLQVERQVMGWLRPSEIMNFQPAHFPIYLFEESSGEAYYGFPTLDGVSVKAARHHGGETTTPDQLRRQPDTEELRRLRDHLGVMMPGLRQAEIMRAKVCMYTDTPDLNFAIGLLPGSTAVAVACGFSGHGFKFSAVVGEVLADLVELGETRLPIAPLSLARLVHQEPLPSPTAR
jgi:sarcosine oxidase